MEEIEKKIILSGVQPTGNLHLGNYLGAIKNWTKLQKNNDCIFCIVDLHAITVAENRESIKRNTKEVAAAYIACGIDPKKSIIFTQSQISAHSELAWILSCFTPMGWLNRMTQFKDKAGKNKEKAPVGLYSYPVLMAADILLYKSTHVPVGEDQKQHLELSRDIAQSFNRFFNNDFFPIPEPIITGSGTRVMSLKDGTKKMSKSDPSDFSRVNLTDEGNKIKKKIQKAKTDSLPFPDEIKELENRPEVKNLIKIFSAIDSRQADKIIEDYSGESFKKFKEDLAEIINEKVSKISSEMKKLLSDESYLNSILFDGKEKASKIASQNIEKIKDIIGFYRK